VSSRERLDSKLIQRSKTTRGSGFAKPDLLYFSETIPRDTKAVSTFINEIRSEAVAPRCATERRTKSPTPSANDSCRATRRSLWICNACRGVLTGAQKQAAAYKALTTAESGSEEVSNEACNYSQVPPIHPTSPPSYTHQTNVHARNSPYQLLARNSQSTA
jgi:hypothetical protein